MTTHFFEKFVGPEKDHWLLGCLAGEVVQCTLVERGVGCSVFRRLNQLTGCSAAVAGGCLIAVRQLLEDVCLWSAVAGVAAAAPVAQ